MMLIFPRYDAASIEAYYKPDFGSKMWAVSSGAQVVKEPFQQLEVTSDGVTTGSVLRWIPLYPTGFTQLLAEGSSAFEPMKGGKTPFALGTIFSPPKSVSLAALAGTDVRLDIMGAHRGAVDFAASILCGFLKTRKKGQNQPVRARVFRFRHPFSRADDPQLHDHLEWIPNPEDGALHTYPWFFFQRAIAQIYHYCLASELVRRGYRIDVNDAEELRWELSGVDRAALEVFSKRSQEVHAVAEAGCRDSLPAALRWAALTSSKALPKAPGLSLSTARERWKDECCRGFCDVLPGERKKSQALELPAVDTLFRKSACANVLTLQGRALAHCLGQTCEPKLAMQQVDHRLLDRAIHGRLVVAEVRSGRAFLMPQRYQEERGLLQLIAAGVGRGDKLSVSVPHDRLAPELKRALKVPNRVRIVSGTFPPAAELAADSGLPSEVVHLARGDASVAMDRLAEMGKMNVVVACNEPFRTGDFFSVAQAISLFGGLNPPNERQRSFTLRKGKGRSGTVTQVEVRRGVIPLDPSLPWMELENRPPIQRAVCIVPRDYPEVTRRAMNMEMARRLILSRPLEEASDLISFDLVVPLMEAQPGMEVVVFKNHPKFYLGTRWTIRAVPTAGSLELSKQRAKITLSAEKFATLEPFLAVVEKRPIRVVPGMLLQAERSFSQRRPVKTSVRKGELVTAVRLDEERNLVLSDGRVIPSRFRAFSPAFLLQTLPKGMDRPRVVLAVAPADNVRAWALEFRTEKLIVLAAEDPARVAAEFGCENTLQNERSRVQRAVRFVSGAGEFVPSQGRCKALLRLHEAVSRQPTVEVTGGPEFWHPKSNKKAEPEEEPKAPVPRIVDAPSPSKNVLLGTENSVNRKNGKKPPEDVEDNDHPH